MKKLLFFSVFVLTIVSCKDEVVSERLTDIQLLQSKVDSSNIEFQSIDTSKIVQYRDNAKRQCDFLKENYHDTVNFDNARYIDVYYGNFKLLRKIMKGYAGLASEINYTSAQLDHLYNDVENGLVDDESYAKFYAGEEKAAKGIIKSVGTLREWEEIAVNRYNGMVQPIDSVILEMQNRGYR